MAAMALNLIVEELITGSAGVVYSDNGSAQSCVGNYVVQFMPVNGDQSNEKRRQKLADLVRRSFNSSNYICIQVQLRDSQENGFCKE